MEGRPERGRRWDRKVQIALGIAIFEGLVAWLKADWSRVTMIVIAVPIILFYLLAGRTLESRLARETSWVLALSQAFAVVAVILSYIIGWLALILAAVFAVVGLYLLLQERPDQPPQPRQPPT
jgi:predicted membrane protein